MANQIVWFDIPVTNLDRAIRFYSQVLGITVEKHESGGGAMGVFPHEGNEVGGCLFQKHGENPSSQGPLLYVNAQDRLDEAIVAVEPNGGKVLEPKHQIGPYGFRCIVLDSEGNRIALHSMG
jgi:predicted enzyme related to lactoylglutathione lyase